MIQQCFVTRHRGSSKKADDRSIDDEPPSIIMDCWGDERQILDYDELSWSRCHDLIQSIRPHSS